MKMSMAVGEITRMHLMPFKIGILSNDSLFLNRKELENDRKYHSIVYVQ